VTTRTARSPERLVLAALAVVLVAPLVVGLIALREPTWFPVLDLAMTEFRVRDVFTSRIPLIGLPGRIGRTLTEQGSHPGPLSFYLVAPGYRLFGSTAWAMQVATVLVHAVAIVAALLIARRRGGLRMAAAVALLLAVLMRGYGITLLTQPWNPYLPVLWWVVLLLAVWSVLDDDVPMLPVAVLAASIAAQTHVPYLALSLGLGALAVAAAVRTTRRDRAAWRWIAAAAVLGVVLWAPPLIDQLTRDPGNLSILLEHFGDPPEEAVGLGTGVELTIQHLDLGDLLASDDGVLERATAGTTGPLAVGLFVLVDWLVSVAIAVRLRHRSLLHLHAVVAAGLVLAAISISRIFGSLWWYLMLWAWGVALLLALAIGWTVVELVRSRRAPRDTGGRDETGGLPRSVLVLGGLTVAVSVLFAVNALDAEPPAPRLSEGLAALVPATVEALEDGVGGATGRDGTYVVSWNDTVHIGSQAYGLVSELERRGFRAGMTTGLRVPLTPYRTFEPGDATVEIHFASGRHIASFAEKPGVVRVASADVRTQAERAEFDRLRASLFDELTEQGLDDIADELDDNLFAASIDPRLERATRERVARLEALGEPMAVFIAPPGTSL
jgi:hypothetical protein